MRLRRGDIEAMRDEQYLFGRWPSGPTATARAEAIDRMCSWELNARGVELVEKRDHALALPGFATNLTHRRLWVQPEFDDRPVDQKAKTKGHELVHFRHREHYGDRRYNWLYVTRARYRLRFEAQCYRETIRILWAIFRSRRICERAADRYVVSLRRNYAINLSNNRRTNRTIRKTLLMDLPA